MRRSKTTRLSNAGVRNCGLACARFDVERLRDKTRVLARPAAGIRSTQPTTSAATALSCRLSHAHEIRCAPQGLLDERIDALEWGDPIPRSDCQQPITRTFLWGFAILERAGLSAWLGVETISATGSSVPYSTHSQKCGARFM